MIVKLAILTLLQLQLSSPPVQRITLDVKDAELHNVLRLLADTGKMNLVVPDDVKGKVTLKLRNVPWTEALAVVLRTKGLGQERVGNIIHIDLLERINARTKEQAEIAKTREANAQLLTVMIPLSYAKAGDLQPIIQSMLSPRGSVAIDARTNVLIVTDVAHKVERVRRELAL